METVVQPPADAELHLLTNWGDPEGAARHRKAAIGTVLLHVAVISILMFLPSDFLENHPEPQEPPRIVTPLIEPPTLLTQKAPNTGKVSKEFDAREEAPRKAIQIPPSPPPAPPPAKTPLRQAAIPAPPAPKPAAPVPLPEPPKLETAQKEGPKQLPQVAQSMPAPAIQPVEKPQLPLQNVERPPAGIGPLKGPAPSPSVGEAIKELAHNNVPGMGLTVGDQSASGTGYGGILQNPTAGVQASNVQLLSDPLGVDFTPYLRQILQTIRRNWMAVMPESVRLGRRGKVVIQFSITKDGAVGKLVYESQSGSDALDRAAVAGISASNPFPPLPSEFKGGRVVLRLNFAYNLPRQ